MRMPTAFYLCLWLAPALLGGLVTCKASSSKPPKPRAGDPSNPSDSESVPTDGGGQAQSQPTDLDPDAVDSVSLELKPGDGTKMRFLNGRALTQVYGRVFKPDENGYAHCAKAPAVDYNGCNFIFAAEERPSVGFFDLYSQRMARGVQNVAQTENMTLNYLRNLRAALGRECGRLVEREEKFSADGDSTNFIVKKEGPTTASLETFFRRLLDINGADIKLNMPFADYVLAYKTAVAMDPDKAKAQHNASINLCLTLAMDPQIFLY